MGSVGIASLLMIMPFAASAQSLQAEQSAGVFISPSGIVRVIGANVTAVSSGVVHAMTTIGSVVMNWVVNVSATTKTSADGEKTATTTNIKLGDKVAFSGMLASSTGSVLTVAATKIREMIAKPFRHFGAGTITSVNSGAGSFVISHGNTSLTVQTTASTTVKRSGQPTTLASLQIGEKVVITGTPNADGTIIAATSIEVRSQKSEHANDNGKHDDDDHATSSKHSKSKGKGLGDLKLFGGFRLGHDKDE